MNRTTHRMTAVALALALAPVAGCSGGASGHGTASTLTLYTSVTQNTVDAVVAGFTAEHPGVHVSVFRALTGTLNARIAADQRTGGVKADVFWGTDPLSMHGLDAQHLFRKWTPDDAASVPAAYRTATSWGTRLLEMVVITHAGTPAPATWADLAGSAYRKSLAIPDPSQVGSALAVLGFFDQAAGYGLDFYRRLKANGAVQVSTIDNVVTGVAQGQYKAGVTLSYSAQAAMAAGSPITISYPSPGAVAIYSPIAVVTHPGAQTLAESFVNYTLSGPGQQVIAGTGWEPILATARRTPAPSDHPLVTPDWPRLFGTEQDLLAGYRRIFGG